MISPADPVNLFNFNQVALEAAVQSLPAVKLIYVPQIGSFGVYQYIFECIDADEEADNNNGAANSPNISVNISV